MNRFDTDTDSDPDSELSGMAELKAPSLQLTARSASLAHLYPPQAAIIGVLIGIGIGIEQWTEPIPITGAQAPLKTGH